MGGAAKIGAGLSGMVGGVDWDKWKPGDSEAALKVSEGRFGDLLKNAGLTLRNIDKTTTDRIGNAIAQGLTNGDTASTIGDAVNAIIDDPIRADVIAMTETSRAFNSAAIDSYTESGLDGWEWLAYEGACDECGDDAGPHNFGDDFPPAHPSCRCGVLPLTQSTDNTEE
jgi:hypothetical protein